MSWISRTKKPFSLVVGSHHRSNIWQVWLFEIDCRRLSLYPSWWERLQQWCRNTHNLGKSLYLYPQHTLLGPLLVVVTHSVGWLLETWTDLQWLLGWLLRFINTILKDSITQLWCILTVLNFFEKTQITETMKWPVVFWFFVKTASSFRFLQ
jgi:hypothetical protein